MTGDCLCLNLGIECWCSRPGPRGLGYAPHGTRAGARRHYRREGPGWSCEPCRQAERRDSQDRPRPPRVRPVPALASRAAGLRIREMRLAARMTQRDLGTALGVSQTNISAREKGEYGTGPEVLARVAAVTGAPATAHPWDVAA